MGKLVISEPWLEFTTMSCGPTSSGQHGNRVSRRSFAISPREGALREVPKTQGLPKGGANVGPLHESKPVRRLQFGSNWRLGAGRADNVGGEQ
jgi:hypothetical protein